MANLPQHLLAANFFTLGSADIELILAEADRVKYRRPKNANGSRARYFHARCVREAGREKSANHG